MPTDIFISTQLAILALMPTLYSHIYLEFPSLFVLHDVSNIGRVVLVSNETNTDVRTLKNLF